jgi:hypothetical protein
MAVTVAFPVAHPMYRRVGRAGCAAFAEQGSIEAANADVVVVVGSTVVAVVRENVVDVVFDAGVCLVRHITIANEIQTRWRRRLLFNKLTKTRTTLRPAKTIRVASYAGTHRT